MNERDFLRSLFKAPNDDLLRLAFADWLEERNDPRAPWVRNREIWRFMAPDAANPIPRMARAAVERDEWEKFAPLAEEMGASSFYSYMGDFVEARRKSIPKRARARTTSEERPRSRSETVERIAEALGPWLAKHRRPCWVPILDDDEGPPTASKFCGTPWIGEAAPWPDCKSCHQPLPLFVQLNLEELPHELGERFGKGLLQLFYCPRDSCRDGGGSGPFYDSISRVRIVHPQGHGQSVRLPELKGFSPSGIGGWSHFIDLPSFAEHEEFGIQHTYDSDSETTRLECPELGLVFDNLDGNVTAEISSSKYGDKLSGWPSWIDNVKYPNCPQCGRRMVFIFQVASFDNVPYMFGDSGTGHITQCPEHKNVVGFGWSCH